jgi:aminoglycoside 3-N-acetyltransferase
MSKENEITLDDIVSGLQDAKIERGDVVLVHSAMRTFGKVQGGGKTVVEAFLKVLGTEGTLIMPTFTFAHESEKEPIIDPQNDKSEMGAISEAVRLHPEALRSTAFRHSFAAIGRRAEVITRVDPKLSPFDLRSSFGVMLALDAKVLLAGLTYSSCTSHHFAEWVCDVPYRHAIPLNVNVRRPDGSIVVQQMTDYQPKPGKDGSYYGSRHTDFNFLGKMLEDKKQVNISFIGNAVIRSFTMRNLISLADAEAKKDYNVFRVGEGSQSGYFTPLAVGRIVISEEMKDGAGRAAHYQWCVCDENKLMANK